MASGILLQTNDLTTSPSSITPPQDANFLVVAVCDQGLGPSFSASEILWGSTGLEIGAEKGVSGQHAGAGLYYLTNPDRAAASMASTAHDMLTAYWLGPVWPTCPIGNATAGRESNNNSISASVTHVSAGNAMAIYAFDATGSTSLSGATADQTEGNRKSAHETQSGATDIAVITGGTEITALVGVAISVTPAPQKGQQIVHVF